VLLPKEITLNLSHRSVIQYIIIIIIITIFIIIITVCDL